MPTTCPSPIKVRTARPALAASLAGLLAGLLGTPAVPAEELNRIVLRVNDRIVTLFDYEERLAERRSAILRASQVEQSVRAEALERAPSEVLRDLLDEGLLVSRGDQLAVEIDAAELEEAMIQARKNFGVEDPAEFQKALEASGLSEPEFRARVRENLVYQQVLGTEVTARIRVEDEDLRRYYREHQDELRVPAQTQLREIVVLDKQGWAAEEQRRVADVLRAELVGGKTLEDAAATAAGGPAAGNTSGVIDLGWVKAGELDADLAAAVANVPAGGYSEPVRGRGGLHILQVVAREEARVRAFEEVEAELRNAERNRRFRDDLEKYMKDLETKAYIVASPPPEAAGFRREAASAPDDEWQTLGGAVTTAPPAPVPDTQMEPPAPSGPPVEPPAPVVPPPVP